MGLCQVKEASSVSETLTVQALHVREPDYVLLQFRNMLRASWSCISGVDEQQQGTHVPQQTSAARVVH